MAKFENMSVTARHFVQAAIMLFMVGGAWGTSMVRLGAVEEQQRQESKAIQEVHRLLQRLQTGAAVTETELKFLKEELAKQGRRPESQDEKLDRILEQLMRK